MVPESGRAGHFLQGMFGAELVAAIIAVCVAVGLCGVMFALAW